MDDSPATATPTPAIAPALFEKIVVGGDLSELNVSQRADYYAAVCRSLGLNPLTRPFEYLTLNGKLRLYALRDCTDQLRRRSGLKGRAMRDRTPLDAALIETRQAFADVTTVLSAIDNLRTRADRLLPLSLGELRELRPKLSTGRSYYWSRIKRRAPGEHPPTYRPLLRRLQRGTYTRAELEWLLRTHPQLPPIVAAVAREKLAQLGEVSPR